MLHGIPDELKYIFGSGGNLLLCVSWLFYVVTNPQLSLNTAIFISCVCRDKKSQMLSGNTKYVRRPFQVFSMDAKGNLLSFQVEQASLQRSIQGSFPGDVELSVRCEVRKSDQQDGTGRSISRP